MTYSASDEPQRVYRLIDRLWAETASELVRTDLAPLSVRIGVPRGARKISDPGSAPPCPHDAVGLTEHPILE
jgi:hypothetical protein